ncbi:hypothetical protein NHP190002_06980 [Helicobacter ailurogastricus]|nr:hypothetical protein NHP190002_06980 [Helicobacter ailurogastricus]
MTAIKSAHISVFSYFNASIEGIDVELSGKSLKEIKKMRAHECRSLRQYYLKLKNMENLS